ncbi:MAG: hypothetical protein LLF97_00930 [Planctomycetaceae bacterium]|nr:hypothetical protein [Planctomycetaceae bacterium]
MSNNQQADDLVEFTNYFSGGDKKREELLAQPEVCAQCQCYSCACTCIGSPSEDNGGYHAHWESSDRGTVNCE